MKKIVIDTFGGDNGVDEMVKGSIEAIKDNKDILVVLVGNEQDIATALSTYSYNHEQIEIVNATEYITNDDAPTSAIREKKNSSLVMGLDLLKSSDEVIGIISAGSTGALLTGAFMKVGRIKGISRPAMCPALPTKVGGKVYLMDCGANMDCKPQNLVHFAIMGNAYLRTVCGVQSPKIGLLNVGTEKHKGNELTHSAYEEISKLGLNFVGNMEARDILSGKYDLIVADGFDGNVALKSTEGAILNMMSMLKKEIKAGFWSKIGALFMGRVFKNLKKVLDYNNHGGAVFIGVKKLVMKVHGSSKYTSIAKSIAQIYDMDECNLIGKITEELEKNDLSVGE